MAKRPPRWIQELDLAPAVARRQVRCPITGCNGELRSVEATGVTIRFASRLAVRGRLWTVEPDFDDRANKLRAHLRVGCTKPQNHGHVGYDRFELNGNPLIDPVPRTVLCGDRCVVFLASRVPVAFRELLAVA